MRRTFCRVVPVRAEIAAFACIIASDDVTLHARHLKLECLFDLRHEAAADAELGCFLQLIIRDLIIFAALMAMVDNADCFAINIKHKARFFATILFIKPNQVLAELRLKYTRNNQDRRMTLGTDRLANLRQLTQVFSELCYMGFRVICLVPEIYGALFSQVWKDALWDRYFTGAPARQRRSVEQYKIVKRA